LIKFNPGGIPFLGEGACQWHSHLKKTGQIADYKRRGKEFHGCFHALNPQGNNYPSGRSAQRLMTENTSSSPQTQKQFSPTTFALDNLQTQIAHRIPILYIGDQPIPALGDVGCRRLFTLFIAITS